MRFLLALLAVMALLVNPVTAAAAQVACGHDGPAAMAGMDASSMSGITRSDSRTRAVDPCCDPAGQHKTDTKSCAQSCAALCAVASAVPISVVGVTLIYTRAPLFAARPLAVPGFRPDGPERPPKLMV